MACLARSKAAIFPFPFLNHLVHLEGDDPEIDEEIVEAIQRRFKIPDLDGEPSPPHEKKTTGEL